MDDCALCDHDEAEHEETMPGSRFLGRCRRRGYYGPTKHMYVECDCPGYEPSISEPCQEATA